MLLPGWACFGGLFRSGPPCPDPLWAWGPFAPPSEFPRVSVLGVCLCFRLLCAYGVVLPLFLWVRLHVPFVSCFGRVCWLFLSTCLPASSGLGAFVFLAVLFFCAVPGFVALSGFLGVHALSGWIGCFFYPKSFRPDIACACRFGW